MKEITDELLEEDNKVKVYCDSQSAVYLSKNQTFHDRTKHIDVRYHFMRDVLAGGDFQLEKIGTEENAVDAFTKSLTVSKFESCLNALKICSL